MNNPDFLTDDALVGLYVNGDNEAFDILLQRHQDALYSYISHQLNRMPDLIDDVFQETFVKVIMCIKDGRYQPSGFFRAWLTRIAHNVIMDLYRYESLVPVVNADVETANFVENHDAGDTYIEAEMINEQTLCEVRHIMNQLPESQREVVYMRYYENRSFKEISALTGSTVNTCLGRMRYGIINMRKIAQEHNIALEII